MGVLELVLGCWAHFWGVGATCGVVGTGLGLPGLISGCCGAFRGDPGEAPGVIFGGAGWFWGAHGRFWGAQLVVEASSRRIVSLAAQWERHRGPLLAEYRHLRALRDSAQVRGGLFGGVPMDLGCWGPSFFFFRGEVSRGSGGPRVGFGVPQDPSQWGRGVPKGSGIPRGSGAPSRGVLGSPGFSVVGFGDPWGGFGVPWVPLLGFGDRGGSEVPFLVGLGSLDPLLSRF